MKPKPKPVRAWGIRRINGVLSELTFLTKRAALVNCYKFEKVVQVEIREVKRGKK